MLYMLPISASLLFGITKAKLHNSEDMLMVSHPTNPQLRWSAKTFVNPSVELARFESRRRHSIYHLNTE